MTLVRETKYVASQMLRDSLDRHQIHLCVLVADTGLWTHPEVHRRLLASGSAAMFPNVRRARPGQGEERGQVLEGIRLDDNSYANLAIKRALRLDRGGAEGFEACHIWPRTCYDPRYHTAVANLVLLPRALAGLTDHDPEIQAALQFRAYELFTWKPDGFVEPQKPSFYPTTWRQPEPDAAFSKNTLRRPRQRTITLQASASMTAEERQLVAGRIHEWASKPELNVHKIIALVVQSKGTMSRNDLVKTAERVTKSKNAYGAVASMLTSKSNAYGRVLEDVNGIIRLHPDVAEIVQAHRWHAV